MAWGAPRGVDDLISKLKGNTTVSEARGTVSFTCFLYAPGFRRIWGCCGVWATRNTALQQCSGNALLGETSSCYTIDL